MKSLFFGAAALLCVATGCSTYSAAVPSVNGKSYVAASKFLDQSMYHCEASEGKKPVCTELKETK